MKLHIQGRDYKVKHRMPKGARDAEAMACLRDQTIYVNRDFPNDGYAACLFHEILEILVNEFDIAIDHRAITALATGLFQVIADNPEVVPWAM